MTVGENNRMENSRELYSPITDDTVNRTTVKTFSTKNIFLRGKKIVLTCKEDRKKVKKKVRANLSRQRRELPNRKGKCYL